MLPRLWGDILAPRTETVYKPLTLTLSKVSLYTPQLFKIFLSLFLCLSLHTVRLTPCPPNPHSPLALLSSIIILHTALSLYTHCTLSTLSSSKETYFSVKGDLLQCQIDLFCILHSLSLRPPPAAHCTLPLRTALSSSKETYFSVKGDLLQCQKRPILHIALSL